MSKLNLFDQLSDKDTTQILENFHFDSPGGTLSREYCSELMETLGGHPVGYKLVEDFGKVFGCGNARALSLLITGFMLAEQMAEKLYEPLQEP